MSIYQKENIATLSLNVHLNVSLTYPYLCVHPLLSLICVFHATIEVHRDGVLRTSHLPRITKT